MFPPPRGFGQARTAASNLADVFEQVIGYHVTPIAGVPKVWAMEIDPDQATEEYRERILGPFRAAMPADVVASIEEQFRSPCTTEMASFDRFVDFIDDGAFDLVVFDTAPTGHTIRLLELPVDWSHHIEESAKGSGQTCLGPVAAIQESKAKYDRAIALLTNPAHTRFVFVLQPERTALYETDRASTERRRIGVTSQELIVNGLLPPEGCESPFFRRRYDMQQEQLDTRSRFERIIARLRDPVRTLFAFVLYPESTPVLEAHRASLDLAAAGIPTQLVIANQVIGAEQATNTFFRRRRAMQQRYLIEIDRRFGVPVLEIPLLGEEPRGVTRLQRIAEVALGVASAPVAVSVGR